MTTATEHDERPGAAQSAGRKPVRAATESFVPAGVIDWRAWVLIGVGMVVTMALLVAYSPRLHPVVPPLPCEAIQQHTSHAALCP